MSQLDITLKELKAAGRHGITKLYMARKHFILGLGELIRRLRERGYKIETYMVPREKKSAFARYILTDKRFKGVK